MDFRARTFDDITDSIGEVPKTAAEILVRVLERLEESWTPLDHGLPQNETDAIDRLVRCGFVILRADQLIEMRGRPERLSCVVTVSGDHNPDDFLKAFCSVAPFDWLSLDGLLLDATKSETTSQTVCLTIEGIEAKANIVAGDEWQRWNAISFAFGLNIFGVKIAFPPASIAIEVSGLSKANVIDPPEDAKYVTLNQMAALVNKHKRTLENRKSRRLNPLPFPDVDGGGGGNADEWVYEKIRPWLEAEFKKKLPSRLPDNLRRDDRI